MNAPQQLSRWTEPGSSRVPFWAYTDAGLYQRELEKIFYGEHWCYVGLDLDEIVRTRSGLKYASRRRIYDSEMVLNPLIYPV